jgi:hypothetical protein
MNLEGHKVDVPALLHAITSLSGWKSYPKHYVRSLTPAETKTEPQLSTRQQVYDALTKEDQYAQGWAYGGRKADAYVSAKTGLPFEQIRWINFAQKYINEALLADANYLKDENAINIRVLKAASLLVSALTVNVTPEQLAQIAGVSSSKFPLYRNGLKDYEDELKKDSDVS